MVEFHGNSPVYLQVVDLFYTLIVSGTLKPGDQIPPVRALAADRGINPNTIQKALQMLEQQAVTVAHVGKGRFVTEDQTKLQEIKAKLLHMEIETFYKKMQQFGVSPKEIFDLLTTYLEEFEEKKGVNKDVRNQEIV